MANEGLENLIRDILKSELKVLRKELKEELPQLLSSTFGGSAAGMAFGAGVNAALDDVLSGKKLDARNVANAMARAVAPNIQDYFNPSGAQTGESLFELISSAQRNM